MKTTENKNVFYNIAGVFISGFSTLVSLVLLIFVYLFPEEPSMYSYGPSGLDIAGFFLLISTATLGFAVGAIYIQNGPLKHVVTSVSLIPYVFIFVLICYWIYRNLF